VPSPFKTRWRVRFNEIDLQGVVHHSQIVIYLEIARLEFWRNLGISYGELRVDGYEFIVHDLHIQYVKPLLFDEIIEATVYIAKLARASFILGYEIRKENGDLAVIAETELVCARLNIPYPAALPVKYREKLK
jgi:acyl-CoA thioester hydrolase